MRDEALQLLLGAVCCEVGDLRLERDREVTGGVDDAGAELEDAPRLARNVTCGAVGGYKRLRPEYVQLLNAVKTYLGNPS